jgi:predicted nucleotidyltransferase
MKRVEEIEKILSKYKEELREEFKVKEIGIFGSCVTGENKKTSDVDILVEFEEPVSLLGLVSLENHLSELLGRKIDLVPKSDIRPELKERILKEAIYL